MKILFVSYYSPLGQGGFEKQARGLFQTLIENGHQIACLCVSPIEKVSELESRLEATNMFQLGVSVIPYQEKSHNFKTKILFWFNSQPAKFLAKRHGNLSELIKEKIDYICQQSKIDYIHCLGLRTAYFIPRQLSIPVIIDLVDSWTQHKARMISYYLKHQLKKLPTALIDFLKTKKIERNVLYLYSNRYPFAVVSSIDAKVLKQLCPKAEVHVVTHPVAISVAKSQLANNPNPNISRLIVFYGFLEQASNQEALMLLVDKILPLVLQKYPDLKLSVTGFNISAKVYHLANQFEWIKVLPSIDKIDDFLDRATLTCWPFRSGSGFKNKILESMVLGKPVVTTTIGAEALTEKQQQGLLIANRAEDLAKHIIYLLDNPQECERLGRINRQIALTEFTWEQKAKDYLKLYQLAKTKKCLAQSV